LEEREVQDLSLFLRRLSMSFSAGVFGALVNSLTIWYFGEIGIPKQFGVSIAPQLTPFYMYPRLVWGGLWGGLFMLNVMRGGSFYIGVFCRGILLSLFPTMFQLFYIFPFLVGKGMMGTALGSFTPLFVIFFNAIWGISAALWLYSTSGDK
jgi:hypothetical protein